MWIEVFRSGTHQDSSGRENEYSAGSIEDIARIYNNAIAKDESRMAPLVKGHPESNSPAYGWVERLARRGNRLLARLKELSPEILRSVKDGKYKKISIALYPDLMLRHVGLLGAVPPAVKGLKNVEFADEEDYKEFSLGDYHCIIDLVNDDRVRKEGEQLQMSFEENEDKKRIREYEEKIALLEKEKRLNEFREYVNSMIRAKDGALITPAQGELLIDILENAHFADMKRDTQDNALTDMIKTFVSKLNPCFDTSEFAADGAISDIKKDFSNKNVSKERLNLHEKALQMKMNTPGISYEEAVCTVQKEMFGER